MRGTKVAQLALHRLAACTRATIMRIERRFETRDGGCQSIKLCADPSGYRQGPILTCRLKLSPQSPGG
jgi:hypothetical protein